MNARFARQAEPAEDRAESRVQRRGGALGCGRCQGLIGRENQASGIDAHIDEAADEPGRQPRSAARRSIQRQSDEGDSHAYLLKLQVGDDLTGNFRGRFVLGIDRQIGTGA